MPEHDPSVLSYVHLAKLSRADEALRTLKKVASVVKPIMRVHKWRVKELAEFYPSSQNLLGLNVNRGSKICLRLRYAGDKDQFMPLENVIDTMLHELCHNVHSPHNGSFHALWEQLRDEYMDLVIRGFTGEAFLSEGRRLGGFATSSGDTRHTMRQAVVKRQNRSTLRASQAEGRRLGGGQAVVSKSDLRKAAADAAERRQRSLRGCATDKLSVDEIHELAESATRTGLRTNAEDNEANDAAIARALSELMEIEERHDPVMLASEQLLAESGRDRTRGESSRLRSSIAESPFATSSVLPLSPWVCHACTLYNQPAHLCCDACGHERSQSHSPLFNASNSIIDLT